MADQPESAAMAPVTGDELAPRPARAWGQDSIYERLLGVRPLLSVRGHTTRIGGSRMTAEVLEAMAHANEYFVDMDELNEAAGRRLAAVTGAEAGLVTAGSFSAMVLAAAACLTGTDQDRIDALPNPTWDRTECLTQRSHQFGYDRAYRAAGCSVRYVGSKVELDRAISERTCMLAAKASFDRNPYQAPDDVMLAQDFIELGQKHEVPVVIDAASELPPARTLTRFVEMGADLVIISGGKGIEGPQSTGILVGRQDLVAAATLNHSPNTAIGRGMKVGKEEIIGLITALDRYVLRDHDAVHETWSAKARYIAARLDDIPGVTATVEGSPEGFESVRLTWDRAVIPLDGLVVAQRLKDGEPRVVYYEDENGGLLQTRTMRDGEEVFAAERLRDFFLNETNEAHNSAG